MANWNHRAWARWAAAAAAAGSMVGAGALGTVGGASGSATDPAPADTPSASASPTGPADPTDATDAATATPTDPATPASGEFVPSSGDPAAGSAGSFGSASSSTGAGTTLPIGDVTSNGRTWKQTYAEGFDRDASLGSFRSVYSTMGFYEGYRDTSGRGLYAPDQVLSVADGNLDMHLRTVDGTPLVATILPDGWAPHDTARVSVRYKTTDTEGFKFVGMLWPSSNNWNEGEIDWPEAGLGGTPRPASAIPGSMSNGMMTFKPDDETFTASSTTDYHTATTEWDHGEVRFYWDGELIASTHEAVPQHDMRVTLQAETALTGAVPADADGHVSIDWISIWD